MKRNKSKPKEPLSEKKLLFAFEQAKERLKMTIDTFDKLKNQSYLFFGALLTLTITITVYYLNRKIASWGEDWPFLATIIYFVVHYIAVCFFLVRNLLSVRVDPIGNEPDKIFEMIKSGRTYKQLLIAESKSYGDRIMHNLHENENMSVNLDNCLKHVKWSPIIGIGICIICSLVRFFSVQSLADCLPFQSLLVMNLLQKLFLFLGWVGVKMVFHLIH